MKRLASPRRTVARKTLRGERVPAAPAAASAVKFSYSITEVSTDGAKARVRSRRATFDEGRFTAEAFDGELGRDAFEALAGQAERFVAAQTAFAFVPFAMFLPRGPKRRDQ